MVWNAASKLCSGQQTSFALQSQGDPGYEFLTQPLLAVSLWRTAKTRFCSLTRQRLQLVCPSWLRERMASSLTQWMVAREASLKSGQIFDTTAQLGQHALCRHKWRALDPHWQVLWAVSTILIPSHYWSAMEEMALHQISLLAALFILWKCHIMLQISKQHIPFNLFYFVLAEKATQRLSQLIFTDRWGWPGGSLPCLGCSR